jgi:hypothetical protein
MIDKIKIWLYNNSIWLWMDTIFWAALVAVGIFFLVKNN